MTTNPHPYTVTMAVAQRQDDLLALCERERRARPAVLQPTSDRRRSRRPAVVLVSRALAFLSTDSRRPVVALRSLRLSRP